MSRSQAPWEHPTVKSLLESERLHFSSPGGAREAKSCIKEVREYAFDVSQEDEVADIFFHMRFIIFPGNTFPADFVEELNKVREDVDGEAKRSDAMYVGSLVQDMFGANLNDIQDKRLWSSEVRGEKDKFNQAAVLAAYWMKSSEIRTIMVRGKKNNSPLAQVQAEVEGLKLERQPLEDAIKTFTDDTVSVLDSNISIVRNMVPELKNVKFTNALTIFKRIKKLEKIWEAELTKRDSA